MKFIETEKRFVFLHIMRGVANIIKWMKFVWANFIALKNKKLIGKLGLELCVQKKIIGPYEVKYPIESRKVATWKSVQIGKMFLPPFLTWV